MSRTNFDGKPIRRVLSWLTNRDLTDSDLATALDMPTTTFSRRKDEDSFPSYEELTRFAMYFDLAQRPLQIAFGYRDLDDLVLLTDKGMQEYLEMGGGNHPHPTMPVVRSRIAHLITEHGGQPWAVHYPSDDKVVSLDRSDGSTLDGEVGA